MRPYLYIPCFCFSTLLAQDIPQMDPAKMEKMMQKMQEIQVCMSKVDLTSLASLEEETLKVQKKVEKMCSDGKREKAQAEAITFYKKVTKMPAMIQMRACTKEFSPQTDPKQKTHVCDGEKIDLGMPENKRIEW